MRAGVGRASLGGMSDPRLTPLVASLPAAVPFTGPEALERRLGVRLSARLGANESGFGPSPLAVEAMERAARDGADLLLIDTAGRLQNRQDLMEELAKIVRVIRKKDPSAPHNTLLVLDATTGQNALSQVEIFRRIADVTGLVMTKLDGTAKGGVLVALADKFGLPIHAIGVGEQIDDLQPFDPEDFARALTGAFV